MTKRILYIEDNFDDRRLVKKILSAHGYEVIVAEDGVRGLELVQDQSYDLILVDVRMPQLDGLETTRRLRLAKNCAQTPIVVLTAYAEQHNRHLYLEAGCTDYQQKQAGIVPLLALVRRYAG
ncbi:MAG: response regulator [Anaerolineae bacterium]|nr:response regulator [Anaerolineae bacterium]